jgi:hypothetical protein
LFALPFGKGVKIINNRERQKSFSYTATGRFSGNNKPDLLTVSKAAGPVVGSLKIFSCWHVEHVWFTLPGSNGSQDHIPAVTFGLVLLFLPGRKRFIRLAVVGKG